MTRRRESRGTIDLPMPSEPFQPLVGGNIALDFANTVDIHSAAKSYDYLFPGYGNLITWSLHANLLTLELSDELMHLAKRDPREAAAARKRAVALREAIFGVLSADDSDDQDHLTVLNEEWRHAAHHRLLVASNNEAIPRWIWDSEPMLDRPLWPVVLAAVDLVTSDHRFRIKICESPTCDLMFIDSTKNGSRRFCRAEVCGNRTRVQRFREGKRVEQS